MKFRLFFTLIINIFFAWGLFLLGTSYNNPSASPLVFLAALTLAALNWAIWNLELRRQNNVEKEVNSIEKKKREHIDSVLRDLSDDDLLRLRRRLLDGTINDERLEDALIGEDGELLYKERS
jgi:hypothetical protein